MSPFSSLASGLLSRVSSDIAAEVDTVLKANSVKYLFLKVGKVTNLDQRFIHNAEPAPRSEGRCEVFPALDQHVRLRATSLDIPNQRSPSTVSQGTQWHDCCLQAQHRLMPRRLGTNQDSSSISGRLSGPRHDVPLRHRHTQFQETRHP